MADSKQKLILKLLGAHLEEINPTNVDPATDAAFTKDLRDKVFRGRTVFGSETIIPFLSLLQSPNPNPVNRVGAGGTAGKSFMDLLLQGFVEDDKANPLDPAYDLMAMVEMRLARLVEIDTQNGDPAFPDEYMLGNLIIDLRIGDGVARPPDDKVSSKAFFYIPLQIEWKSDRSNPYAV